VERQAARVEVIAREAPVVVIGLTRKERPRLRAGAGALARLGIWPVALLAPFILSSPARAGEITYRESWNVARRAGEIVGVLTDYGRYCDRGCRYRYPGVKETLVLPYRKTPSSFYVWTFVEDIKNSEWFSRVTVQTRGRLTVVQFEMLTGRPAEELARISGKPNDSVFDSCLTRYRIEEIFRGERFLCSQLTFTARVTVSGLISLFSGAIRSGLRQTAGAIIANVRRGGGPLERQPPRNSGRARNSHR
jgi:hypothetical protein